MYCLVLLSALLVCAAGVPLSITKPRLDGRIVGGNPTDINSYPHQISLYFNGAHICGGSIFSPTWVVTAAHCIIGSNPSSFSVRAGSNFTTSDGSIHSVIRLITHPNYNSGTYDYDVALVQVSPAFTIDNSRQPIPLECGTVPVGTGVVVTGWGATSEGGPGSTILQEVTVQIINDTQCISAYAAWGVITPRMICAGVTGGGKDACQGDNGGPLIITANPRRLVGIVSWGVGCARPQYPGVYTKVSAVCDWIVANAV